MRRTLTIAERRLILGRQGGCCAEHVCRVPFSESVRPEFDHIHQLSRGGADDATNIRALCNACHRRKTARDARERAHEARLAAKHAGRWARVTKKIPSAGIPGHRRRSA